MTTTSIRLAKNDTRLASALAKAEVTALDECIGRKLNLRLSTKYHIRNIREAYAGFIVEEAIARPTGSRAKWSFAVLDPFGAEGGGLRIVMLRHVHGRTYPVAGWVHVTRHALERALHRSVGEADLRAAVALILPHLKQLPAHVADNLPPNGSDISVILPQGALLCTVVEERIIAKTWIDADMYHSKQRKALCRAPLGAVVVTTWKET